MKTKTRKIANVDIPGHYTLSVVVTDVDVNRFRVYQEWYERATWDTSDPDGKFKMLTPPRNHKKLIGKYADLASAMYLVYQHTVMHNIG